jgi:hypothetical protein
MATRARWRLRRRPGCFLRAATRGWILRRRAQLVDFVRDLLVANVPTRLALLERLMDKCGAAVLRGRCAVPTTAPRCRMLDPDVAFSVALEIFSRAWLSLSLPARAATLSSAPLGSCAADPRVAQEHVVRTFAARPPLPTRRRAGSSKRST